MQCDLCQDQPATVFFSQIINGQMQKMNLCEKCSQQKGVTDSTSFALAELLLGLGQESAAPVAKSTATTELTCEACGFTQSDFKKAGRLGCDACYQVFGEEIGGLLRNIHKGTRHLGKVPARVMSADFQQGRAGELREQLARAIAEERYEDAARLRDELSQIENAPTTSPRDLV